VLEQELDRGLDGATSTAGSWSLPLRSMPSSSARTVSTMCSSASAMASFMAYSPSRSLDSNV
jgi:hypothetical protein